MKTAPRGLLLLNLGTPESPAPDDVGRYLNEFLMDPHVVDIPWLLRWILVKALIVPKRKVASGKLYESIWTERGSPLLYHLRDLREHVQKEFDQGPNTVVVDVAMRYGQPTVAAALQNMAEKGAKEVVVFPLYPQYAASSTLSSLEACERAVRDLRLDLKLKFVEPFYRKPAYVDAFSKLIREGMERDRAEHLVMSFHGLPERHVKKTDLSPSKTHCLADASCCDQINEFNRDCYRAQCFASARAIAKASGVADGNYSVSFQSRLGRSVWIRPYTDQVIPELARQGIKRLAVACPSFVADCLETLEENQIRGREAFMHAGGEHFTAVPCPNADPVWAHGVVELAQECLAAKEPTSH